MRFSPAASAAFDLVFRPWRRRRLHVAPWIDRPVDLPADRPLVLIANHTSWWDGFLLRDLHAALRPGTPMYTVMTEAELRKHPFLRLLGAVPLQPGSPGSLLRLLRSLGDAVQQRPATTIVFFPQGRIWPSARRPLGFQRGVETLLRAVGPCTVLPVGIHIEPLNHAAPTAFVTLGQPRPYPGPGLSADALEDAVSERLDRLAAMLDRHGEALPATLAGSTPGLPQSADTVAQVTQVTQAGAPA
jgi:1-acyl-sn-glycerol-3-phosphate acyltransferase